MSSAEPSSSSSQAQCPSPSAFFLPPGDFLSSLACSSASSFLGLACSSSAFPSSSASSSTGQTAQILARNSTKTLKCPKCNWHYKYQETLEIHMKEKHADQEVLCMFCVENQAHPKLARGETYSCGYKPYRCELCKYSTTTKGNLSIHMQSDKHLHALQEIPQSLAAAGPSQLFLGQFGQSVKMDPSAGGFSLELCHGALQCLVCLSLSTDRFEEMLAHLDKDRTVTQEGDVAALHGFFQCLLCPYSTNLKANFQLHTRTDKHLQRVQLINHLREGSALLGPAEQFARLGSLKSAVQVRCQPCQEIFSCEPSLREHCQSWAHLHRMAGHPLSQQQEFMTAASVPPSAMERDMAAEGEGEGEEQDELTLFLRNALFRCGLCPFESGLLERALEHANSPAADCRSTAGAEEGGGVPLPSAAEDEERRIGWEELDQNLVGKGLAISSSRQKMEDSSRQPPGAAKCPLCAADVLSAMELVAHIVCQHNTPEEVARRLAAVTDEQNTSNGRADNVESSKSPPAPRPPLMVSSPSTGGLAQSSSPEAAIYRHCCPHCSLAFRVPEQLQVHSLSHSSKRIRLRHRCEFPDCDGGPFPTKAALEEHLAERHLIYNQQRGERERERGGGKQQTGPGGGHFCDICQDGQRFDSDQALMAHFNSEQHLQRTARPPLENGGRGTQQCGGSAAGGTKRKATPSKVLPFVCNVCALAFGQPGTLDTHLRSMAHAQRMARLAELVQSGELDPQKPVFEQPESYPPERSIGEMAKEQRKKSMGKLGTHNQQQSCQPPALEELVKQQQDQQLMAQMMVAQMLMAHQQDGQQQSHSAGANAAAAAQQMAQMMMAAQMAAAAAAATGANGGLSGAGFGLLDMLGLGKPPDEPPMSSNGSSGGEQSDDGGPRQKQPRKEGSPVVRRQSALGRSREGSTVSPTVSAVHQPPAAGLDLASVLQALASGSSSVSTASALPSALPFPFVPPSTPDPGLLMAMAAVVQLPSSGTGLNGQTQLQMEQQAQQHSSNAPSPSPQKRARTRIGDEQIKILRQYFDINNSPSEEHIKEMAQKALLPEKVIKHWFRNTLFKERQRDKDSPYNFSIPPQMGIDLATYHRTGEAKIVPLVKQESKDENEKKEEEEENGRGKEQNREEEGEDEREASRGEGGGATGGGEVQGEMGWAQTKGKLKEEAAEPEEEEQKIVQSGEEHTGRGCPSSEGDKSAAESVAAAAADLLANMPSQSTAASFSPGFPFSFGTPAEQLAQMFSAGLPFAAAANPFVFNGLPAPFGGPSLPFNPFVPTPAQPHAITASLANSGKIQQQQHCGGANALSLVQQNNPQAIPSTSASSQLAVPAMGTSGSMGTGRRANRTRFSDFQLRTLQEFFDRQAYPKDDDLEMLSNKMGLSPRVIVVWFQNARQKARKVYEQQPHLLAHAQQHSVESLQRFVRTPSNGFPCSRCDQVFQRYQELNQHQHKVCFTAAEEHGIAQARERERPDQQQAGHQQSVPSGTQHLLNGGGERAATAGELQPKREERRTAMCRPESAQELLRQLMAGGPVEHKQEVAHRPFHKRCPFCGLLFHCRDKLAQHLPARHPEQPPLELDALPDAEEVPGLDLLAHHSSAPSNGLRDAFCSAPLDLSVTAAAAFPTLNKDNGINDVRAGREESTNPRSSTGSLSPCPLDSNNDPLSDSQLSCSPLSALLPSLFQPILQRPQLQLSPHQSNSSNSSKRFRTHLTPMQVFIMKSLFTDYKTPSMQECESLGRRIGLHKRVVQVWFQNARAKERKAQGGIGEAEEAVPSCGSLQHCQLCDRPLGGGGGQPLQEHIFSVEHLDRIRDRGAQLRGVGDEPAAEGKGETNCSSTADDCQQGQEGTSQQEESAALAQLAQLPYYALAAAASGLVGQPGLPSLLYDPSLFGTPVPALKIPESVMQHILEDMGQRREQTRFTQDGLELAQLEAKLSARDFAAADTVDLEVGWGCPQCGYVFQQPELLQNHQKLICAGSEGVFRLVQTHYQCGRCQLRFGTQDDFCVHCLSEAHRRTD